MFLCEPLESPKSTLVPRAFLRRGEEKSPGNEVAPSIEIGRDIGDEPVTHCTEFL